MKVDIKMVGKDVADVLLLDEEGKILDTIHIRKELEFGDNIDEEMEQHSAMQWYFEQLLAEQRRTLSMFRDVEIAKYMAHCRLYAKYLLKGLGEKDTIEGRLDAVVMAFNKDVTDAGTTKFARSAYRGYLTLTYGAKGATEKEGQTDYTANFDQFYDDMYEYQLGENGYYYDDVIRALSDEEFRLNSLQAITSAFISRGFMLRSFVNALIARQGNVAPLVKRGEGLSEETQHRIKTLENGKERDLLNTTSRERSK